MNVKCWLLFFDKDEAFWLLVHRLSFIFPGSIWFELSIDLRKRLGERKQAGFTNRSCWHYANIRVIRHIVSCHSRKMLWMHLIILRTCLHEVCLRTFKLEPGRTWAGMHVDRVSMRINGVAAFVFHIRLSINIRSCNKLVFEKTCFWSSSLARAGVFVTMIIFVCLVLN